MPVTRAALLNLPEPLLSWYAANARPLPWRENPTGYRVWVSEIMLQQTRVEAVKPYYERFLAAMPDVAALAAAPDDRLMKLWEGLGYYSRARNLKRAAGEIVSRHAGELPRTYLSLLALPGIGEYTAGAIASIAFGAPVPAVDGNVLRVLARYCKDEGDIALPAAKKTARAALEAMMPRTQPGAFNQALMELGALVCLPNGHPQCPVCPLKGDCQGHAAGMAAALPVKGAKPSRREEALTVFVLRGANGFFLVRKRSDQGLLGSLWELPNLPGHLALEDALARLWQWRVRPRGAITERTARHVFTHVTWNMRVYDMPVDCAASPMGWAWEEAAGSRALPTAFRVCL